MLEAINLLLSHQPRAQVQRMIAHWTRCVPPESLVIAYGGSRAEFERIEHARKFFVDDPRLRTRDHQRELQSYTGIFRGALEFARAHQVAARHLHFAEYDHVPLIEDLNARQVERLENEGADLLGFHVQRVDGTSYAHFLYHAANPEFAPHWRKVTRRADADVVLSMFGTGSFWRWEAFEAVASAEEEVPCYMEIYLPTAAHHFGFRVRDFGEQDRFVRNLGEFSAELENARTAGAWTLHPCKRLWTD